MGTVSVVVTVRNEERNLPHLLESLLRQRGLADVVLVDAASTDRTLKVAQDYEESLPLRWVSRPCTRGEGRNIGAAMATGDLLAFTDGDCMAGPRWTEALLAAWEGNPERVVAGRTFLTGFWAFTKLHRVELARRGQDTTWPSCNLAYPKALFDRLGGFDTSFITAEDIDLNVRAIDAGAHIRHAPDAVVYARARDSISGFLRQAYWNGYGRKQLTRKHGSLWSQYSFGQMVAHQGGSFWGTLRMGAGAFGYLAAKRRRPR